MKVAFIILTCKSFFAEAILTKNKLNQYSLHNFTNCYIATKNTNHFLENNIDPKWKLISVPDDCDTWGEEIKFITSNIDEEYLFLWVDDIYPYKFINFNNLFNKINKAISYNPAMIRINSNFNNRRLIKKYDSDIYIELRKHKYISSIVLSIFQKKFLNHIVSKNDSPWDFEYQSSKRFDFKEYKFLFIKDPFINIINLVVKAKILNSSFTKLQSNEKKFLLDNTTHKKFNLVNEIFYLFKLLISRKIYYPFAYQKLKR